MNRILTVIRNDLSLRYKDENITTNDWAKVFKNNT